MGQMIVTMLQQTEDTVDIDAEKEGGGLSHPPLGPGTKGLVVNPTLLDDDKGKQK